MQGVQGIVYCCVLSFIRHSSIHSMEKMGNEQKGTNYVKYAVFRIEQKVILFNNLVFMILYIFV